MLNDYAACHWITGIMDSYSPNGVHFDLAHRLPLVYDYAIALMALEALDAEAK